MRGLKEGDPYGDKINIALEWLTNSPLIVVDNPNITSDQILAKATQLHIQDKLDVLVVVYLQLIKEKGE
jgi:replicative DNA helicase